MPLCPTVHSQVGDSGLIEASTAAVATLRGAGEQAAAGVEWQEAALLTLDLCMRLHSLLDAARRYASARNLAFFCSFTAV